jgi:hypothetical protein
VAASLADWLDLFKRKYGEHAQRNAPGGRLYVDPHLPPWLPDMTLLDLRLGQSVLDIRFWREGDSTQFEVLRGDPDAVEVRSISLASNELSRGF